MSDEKKDKIQIYFPYDLGTEIRIEAAKRRKKLSQFIVEAIREYIDAES